jgi:hypothetical protein
VRSYAGKSVFNGAFDWLITQANKDAWQRALVETAAGRLLADGLGIAPARWPAISDGMMRRTRPVKLSITQNEGCW